MKITVQESVVEDGQNLSFLSPHSVAEVITLRCGTRVKISVQESVVEDGQNLSFLSPHSVVEDGQDLSLIFGCGARVKTSVEEGAEDGQDLSFYILTVLLK